MAKPPNYTVGARRRMSYVCYKNKQTNKLITVTVYHVTKPGWNKVKQKLRVFPKSIKVAGLKWFQDQITIIPSMAFYPNVLTILSM